MKNDMKSVVVPVEVIDRLKALAEEGMYSNEMLMSLPPKNAVAYRLMEIVTPLLAAAPAPSSLAGGGSGLRAHFKAMQAMATAYLVPEDYRDRDGKITLHGDHNNTDQWKQGQRGFRAEAFANDMVYMLDGPEERAALSPEAPARAVGPVWNPHQITPNDIAAILDENADCSDEGGGLLNASQLAEKIWRAGLAAKEVPDLHAIVKDAAERVHKNGGCVPQMAYAPILFALQDALTPRHEAPAEGAWEQCVKVCPQCDGEGEYADGVDEAACSTPCTRCGSNGWIVDLSALRAHPSAPEAREDYSSLIAARCVALPGKLIDCPVCLAVDNERDRQAATSADKLRIAVEALEKISALRVTKLPCDSWAETYSGGHSAASERDADIADQALAALKAEGAK